MIQQCASSTLDQPSLEEYHKKIVSDFVDHLFDQIVTDAVNNQLQITQCDPLRDINQQIRRYPIYNDHKIKSTSSITLATGSRFFSENQIIEPEHAKTDKSINDPQRVVSQLQKSYFQVLGHKMNFNGDFIEAKYYFLKLSNKQGLSISRDLDHILTVKNSNSELMKSILAICLPFTTERPVYQLENHYNESSKIKRIKLIRVSGKQEEYETFCRKLIFEFWRNHLIDLSSEKLAQIVCLMETDDLKSQLEYAEKALSSISVKKLQNCDRFDNWRESFMINVKKAERKVLDKIDQFSERLKVEEFEMCLQRILFDLFCGYNFYFEIFIEKTNSFLEIRKNILSTRSVKAILQYLEVDIPSSLILQNSEFVDPSNIPYSLEILLLSKLSRTIPLHQNLQIVREFNCQMAKTYYQYKRESQKAVTQQQSQDVFDMDSQLPVTIYCVLMCQNSDANPIITALLDYYEFQDGYGSENRTITALNAAFEFIRNQWDLSPQVPVK